MTGISWDTSDLNKLAVDLGQAGQKVGDRVQVAIRKTALDIKGDAKKFCPVDTGNLRDSIGTSDLRSVGQAGVLEVEIGPTANYGGFVEFGTSRHGPAAYMGPALDRRTPDFVTAMEQLAGEMLT